MKTLLNEFVASEDGAITVDWVVISAAVMLLSLGIILAVQSGSSDAADRIGDTMISNSSL